MLSKRRRRSCVPSAACESLENRTLLTVTANFNPGPGIGLGYDDLKTIEAYQFLKSVAEGQQGQPGFEEALAVANVQRSVQRSWESERWEAVTSTKIA